MENARSICNLQKTYLGGKGIDTSEMSDDEIRQANTGSYVIPEGSDFHSGRHGGH